MNTYTNQQIQNTLSIIDAAIVNCEKTQPKLKEGSASLSLSKNRIKALYISKALLAGEETAFTKEKLEKAALQIRSIKSKSTTGLGNARKGSSTFTRFYRLIEAMDITLDYLENALLSASE